VVSTDLPPGAEAYLRTATCLLPPHLRRAVAGELHANLYQAMLDGLTAGKTEPDAWATALHACGSRWWVALGLARVHTLPLLLRTLLAAGALGGAASALWGNSAEHTHPVPAHGAQP